MERRGVILVVRDTDQGGIMIHTDSTPTICSPRVLPDVIVTDEGSIWFFTPVSAAAKAFFDEYVGDDETRYFGEATVVEHRYAHNLIDGLLDEGFVLA